MDDFKLRVDDFELISGTELKLATLYTLALDNAVYIPIVHTLNSISYVVSPYKITYQSKFNSYNLLL